MLIARKTIIYKRLRKYRLGDASYITSVTRIKEQTDQIFDLDRTLSFGRAEVNKYVCSSSDRSVAVIWVYAFCDWIDYEINKLDWLKMRKQMQDRRIWILNCSHTR